MVISTNQWFNSVAFTSHPATGRHTLGQCSMPEHTSYGKIRDEEGGENRGRDEGKVNYTAVSQNWQVCSSVIDQPTSIRTNLSKTFAESKELEFVGLL
jgi:hypothetical protein